jgi:hypothetical protein
MNLQKPIRVSHTYRQQLKGSPGQVFPLLCPVREKDWVEGWNPVIVYSFSGYAERDCIFIIPEGNSESIWMVIHYDPENYAIEFVKVTPGMTAGRINIRLHGDEVKGTIAEITYMYTALSEHGRTFVEQFTAETYLSFMKKWEDALNHYLLTGNQISIG